MNNSINREKLKSIVTNIVNQMVSDILDKSFDEYENNNQQETNINSTKSNKSNKSDKSKLDDNLTFDFFNNEDFITNDDDDCRIEYKEKTKVKNTTPNNREVVLTEVVDYRNDIWDSTKLWELPESVANPYYNIKTIDSLIKIYCNSINHLIIDASNRTEFIPIKAPQPFNKVIDWYINFFFQLYQIDKDSFKSILNVTFHKEKPITKIIFKLEDGTEEQLAAAKMYNSRLLILDNVTYVIFTHSSTISKCDNIYKCLSILEYNLQVS